MKEKAKEKGIETTKYKGKTAIWYWAILLMVNLMPFLGFWGDRITEVLLYSAIADFVLLPPAFRNYLILTKKTLTVAFGFGTDEIAVKDIAVIKETRSPIATGALSFDRLRIRTGEKNFLCSIKQKEEFLKEIKRHNRKIIIERRKKKKGD